MGEQADWLELLEHTHPRSAGAVTAYRCEEHKIRPTFYLLVCGPRATACEHVGPLSRPGCIARKWAIRLRDRSRAMYARCFDHRRITGTANPKGEEDFLDMFGQPGQK
jgi:hypothetical protein